MHKLFLFVYVCAFVYISAGDSVCPFMARHRVGLYPGVGIGGWYLDSINLVYICLCAFFIIIIIFIE